jgi:ferredoxin-NADP reductase
VTLFHGVRSSADHAFKTVVRDLAAQHPNLELHILYSAPEAGDVEGRDFNHPGVLTLDLITRTVPFGRHLYYVCGPAAMMELVVTGLSAAGVADGDIHFEAFGPATVRRGPRTVAVPQATFDVQFRQTGRTLPWDGASATLLDFAESNGIAIPTGCRSGSCGTCETRLVEGRVAYATAPEYDVTTGFCLPCVAVPQSAVVLDA